VANIVYTILNPNASIFNYNTRRTTYLYLFRAKHEFATTTKQLPYVVNNAPGLVIEMIETHSFVGFVTLNRKQCSTNIYGVW